MGQSERLTQPESLPRANSVDATFVPYYRESTTNLVISHLLASEIHAPAANAGGTSGDSNMSTCYSSMRSSTRKLFGVTPFPVVSVPETPIEAQSSIAIAFAAGAPKVTLVLIGDARGRRDGLKSR